MIWGQRKMEKYWGIDMGEKVVLKGNNSLIGKSIVVTMQ